MITKGLLSEWDACWFSDGNDGDALWAAAVGDRTEVSPREAAGIESVSLDDRLWVLCGALWHRSESAARTFAIDSAAMVSHLAGRPQDQTEHARLIGDLRRIYAMPDFAEQRIARTRWSADIARCAAALAANNPTIWEYARAAWISAENAIFTANAHLTAGAAARAIALADDAGLTTAFRTIRDAELRKAIDRALVALGPDADGWS